ncbi:SseB family protein [Streptomyces winkii]|uniref:SseB family protein n=1 Tax=Streptomyces winkii TaxID=3051178 RepID=UPI0028D4EB6C|nr:SseB family protein [Streptomyces sp. DSM 40971]
MVQLTELVAAEQQVREQAAAAVPEFTAFLDDFRHRAVLVPLDDEGGIWSAELGGIRWILAFSDEKTLTRFVKRGAGDAGLRQPATSVEEGKQVWVYRKVLGWRLLDSVIPAAGQPCGVALDAGSARAKVLPPVAGIVPDKATLDAYATGGNSRR